MHSASSFDFERFILHWGNIRSADSDLLRDSKVLPPHIKTAPFPRPRSKKSALVCTFRLQSLYKTHCILLILMVQNSSLFIESLHGLSTIRAFGWEPDLLDLNLELLDHSQRPFYLLFCIQQWLALVLGLLSAGLAVILVALVVTLRSISTPGFTGLALLNMMTFNQSLMAMVVYWTKVEICLGAVARIRNFELDVKTENLPDENDNPPDDWPRNGDIEFRNVSASYK